MIGAVRRLLWRIRLSGYVRWHDERRSVDMIYWSIAWGRVCDYFYIEVMDIELIDNMSILRPYLHYKHPRLIYDREPGNG